MGDLRVMGIHGLGDHRNAPWADRWEAAIRSQLPSDVSLTFRPFSYDDIFEKIKITETEAFTAFIKLAGSGLIDGIGGLFSRRSRTLSVEWPFILLINLAKPYWKL